MNVDNIERKPGVYLIKNTVNGYCYIGSSTNIKQRVWSHMAPSQWKNQPNNQMYIDIQEFGLDKFEAEVLEYCDVVNLKEKEELYIVGYKPEYNKIAAKRHTEYKPAKMTFHGKRTSHAEYDKTYYNHICFYCGRKYSLKALEHKLRRMGIPHATIEAKKYIIK